MARLCCWAGLLRPAATGAIRPLWWLTARTVVLITAYYALSIGLTFYQNQLLKEIKYPLMIVVFHLFVKFFLASIFRIIFEIWTKQHRVLLDCSTWVQRLSIVGLSGGWDIALSNWGQEFITVSLYTMTKSTAIIFILLFALVLKLEEKHWSLVVIVAMISGGLIMFTYKSTQFQPVGFLLVLAASFLSGLRWSVTQLVVQRSTLGLQNPIDMVYHVQPWMLLAVLPFAAYFEGPELLQKSIPFETAADHAAVYHVARGILVGAIMAFAMELAEYLVISFTSSLTFAVAGIFKEICTLVLAVIVNKDKITFLNCIGLLMCLLGIICHVAFKFTKSTTDMKNSASNSRPVNPGTTQVSMKSSNIPGSNTTGFLQDYDSDNYSKHGGDNMPLLSQEETSHNVAFFSDGVDSEDEQIIWRA